MILIASFSGIVTVSVDTSHEHVNRTDCLTYAQEHSEELIDAMNENVDSEYLATYGLPTVRYRCQKLPFRKA